MIYGNAKNSELILVATNLGLYIRKTYSTTLQPLGPNWNTVSVAATDDLSSIWVVAAQQNVYSFSVYVSTDGGNTFQAVGSPSSLYQFSSPLVYAKQQLILGTRHGVYVCTPPNYNWAVLGSGLPSAAVVGDIEYNSLDNLLIIGTIGRSVWTLPF